MRVAPAAGQGLFSWDYGIAWRSRVSGDVDGNDRIDVRDVVMLERSLTEQITLDQQQRARADAHPAGGDGALDAADLLALKDLALTN